MEDLDRCSWLSRSGKYSHRIPIFLSWCSRQEKNGTSQMEIRKKQKNNKLWKSKPWQKNMKGKAARKIKHKLVSPLCLRQIVSHASM